MLIKILQITCFASAALQAFLFYQLMFFPGETIGGFNVTTTETVDFVARRAAVLFLGLSLLSLLCAMSIEKSTLVAACLSVPWLGLAISGTAEYLRGFVGKEIFPAIAIEATLGLCLLVFAGAVIYVTRNAVPAL